LVGTLAVLLLLLPTGLVAQPMFHTEAPITVDGRADYGYGIVVDDGGESLTLTAEVKPDWLALDHDSGWVVSTFAGGVDGVGYQDGDASVAQFKNMYGITLAADGFFYLADTHNHRIRRIDPDTGATTTFAGSGERALTDGTGEAASFFFPQGIASDDESLYVADAFNNAIRQIDLETASVTTVVGDSGTRALVDGDLASARFNRPKGIAVAAGGLLYVADSDNNAIRVIDVDADSVATLELDVSLASPRGMEFDGDGDLLIADKDNHLVRSLDLDSLEVTDLAGGPEVFQHPFDVALDDEGNIFVVDSSNHRVQRIDAETQEVTDLAGDGTAGYVEGLSDHAQFYFPRSLTIGPDGAVFVSDRSNGAIRRLERTTAQLVGIATDEQIGDHEVTLRASTSAGDVDQSFTISVVGFNARPEISGIPARTVSAGSEFRFEPEARDDDEDVLTFEIFQKPNWARFNFATGVLSGTPADTDVKLFTQVAITVDDGTGMDNSRTTLAPFNIMVTPPVEPTDGSERVEEAPDAGNSEDAEGDLVDAASDLGDHTAEDLTSDGATEQDTAEDSQSDGSADSGPNPDALGDAGSGVDPVEDDGCGCEFRPGSGPSPGWLALVIGLLLILPSRRSSRS